MTGRNPDSSGFGNAGRVCRASRCFRLGELARSGFRETARRADQTELRENVERRREMIRKTCECIFSRTRKQARNGAVPEPRE